MMNKPLKLTVYVHDDLGENAVGSAVEAAVKAIREDQECWCSRLTWDTKRRFNVNLQAVVIKQLSGWRVDVSKSRPEEP